MGAARKLWQNAKASCPAWEGENKKDDFGPMLDKLEDALKDLSAAATKIQGSSMKARELVNAVQDVGKKYRRGIDAVPAGHADMKAHFWAGVDAAVRQLEKRHSALVHEKLRAAVRELSEVQTTLDGLR